VLEYDGRDVGAALEDGQQVGAAVTVVHGVEDFLLFCVGVVPFVAVHELPEALDAVGLVHCWTG